MASGFFNIAKGRFVTYLSLPAANDAIIVVPLLTAGLVADATLADYDDVAALLAGASDENTTVGRKTITSVTVTVDDTNERVDTDTADITWTAPAASGAISKLVFAYDPDTTTGTDSSLIPLFHYDVTWTPDGNDFTVVIHANGLARAA